MSYEDFMGRTFWQRASELQRPRGVNMPDVFEEQEEVTEAGEMSSIVGEEIRSVGRKGIDHIESCRPL